MSSNSNLKAPSEDELEKEDDEKEGGEDEVAVTEGKIDSSRHLLSGGGPMGGHLDGKLLSQDGNRGVDTPENMSDDMGEEGEEEGS